MRALDTPIKPVTNPLFGRSQRSLDVRQDDNAVDSNDDLVAGERFKPCDHTHRDEFGETRELKIVVN